MAHLFGAGLAVIAAGTVWFMMEIAVHIPRGRSGDRVKGAVAVVLLGVILLAPKAFHSGVEWYSEKVAERLRRDIERIIDVPESTTP